MLHVCGGMLCMLTTALLSLGWIRHILKAVQYPWATNLALQATRDNLLVPHTFELNGEHISPEQKQMGTIDPTISVRQDKMATASLKGIHELEGGFIFHIYIYVVLCRKNVPSFEETQAVHPNYTTTNPCYTSLCELWFFLRHESSTTKEIFQSVTVQGLGNGNVSSKKHDI